MVWTGPIADPLADERERCEVWFRADLADEDREWIRRQWELIGVQPPDRDISWIHMEKVR